MPEIDQKTDQMPQNWNAGDAIISIIAAINDEMHAIITVLSSLFRVTDSAVIE